MKRVLIVDDEPDFRAMLKKRLGAGRFEVIEASNGASGLEIARREKPDLILLDVMMPEKDGILTYVELRKDAATKGIPVIFLTALSPDNSMTNEGLDMMAFSKHGVELDGKYGVLGKPYDPQQLIQMVRTQLGIEGQEGA